MNQFCNDNKGLMLNCRKKNGKQAIKDKLTESIRDKIYIFPDFVLNEFNCPEEQDTLIKILYLIAVRINQEAARKRRESERQVAKSLEQVPEDGPGDTVDAVDATHEDGPTDTVDVAPDVTPDAPSTIDGSIAIRHQDRLEIVWLKSMSAYVNDGMEVLDGPIKLSSLSYEKFMADARRYFDPEKEGLRMEVFKRGKRRTTAFSNEDEWIKALRIGYNETKNGYQMHIVPIG